TAGELEPAIEAFNAAIDLQRTVHQQAQDVADYRKFLSKHLFNYGRVLRKAGRPAEAIEAALERRAPWQDDGEHLGQVAVELGEAARQLRGGNLSDGDVEAAARAVAEAVETLKLAEACGGDLASLKSQPALSFL